MRKSLIVLIVILAFACSSNKLPKGILTEKQITPVLVELHLAEAINSHRNEMDLARENYQEDLYLTILKKYKLDEKVFEASILYYGKHPDKYKPVYDEVLNRLNEMSVMSRAKDSIDARKPIIKATVNDTANVITNDTVKTNVKDTVPASIPMI